MKRRLVWITVGVVLLLAFVVRVQTSQHGYISPVHKPSDGFGLSGDVLGESLSEFTNRHSHYDFHFRRPGEKDVDGTKPPFLMVKHFPLCFEQKEEEALEKKDAQSCLVGFANPATISGIPITGLRYLFLGQQLTQIQAYLSSKDLIDLTSYFSTLYGPVSDLNMERAEEVYGQEMDVKGAWNGPGSMCVGILKNGKNFGYIIIDSMPMHTSEEWHQYFSSKFSTLK